ncbi:MAG: DUF4142 domain-containing protein [Hyphomicrobium sp.]|nr:DUF4142 domain-containing protein [Hyphomicrobium sp.]
MRNPIGHIAAAVLMVTAASTGEAADNPTDAQIAHIAYTAGDLDIKAAQLALQKSNGKEVRAFADNMVKDHTAVNDQALALVKKLNITPEDNATSQSLSKDASAKLADLSKLSGASFDKAYVENEIAYHKMVNAALSSTLIPNASNGELKSLLQTGLKIFQGHEQHAEHIARGLK